MPVSAGKWLQLLRGRVDDAFPPDPCAGTSLCNFEHAYINIYFFESRQFYDTRTQNYVAVVLLVVASRARLPKLGCRSITGVGA